MNTFKAIICHKTVKGIVYSAFIGLASELDSAVPVNDRSGEQPVYYMPFGTWLTNEAIVSLAANLNAGQYRDRIEHLSAVSVCVG